MKSVARARLSLGLVATFLGLASLHVLEPAFNSGHLISEYQLSRHGWVMSWAPRSGSIFPATVMSLPVPDVSDCYAVAMGEHFTPARADPAETIH